jgi:hypothetical protein
MSSTKPDGGLAVGLDIRTWRARRTSQPRCFLSIGCRLGHGQAASAELECFQCGGEVGQLPHQSHAVAVASVVSSGRMTTIRLFATSVVRTAALPSSKALAKWEGIALRMLHAQPPSVQEGKGGGRACALPRDPAA